MLDEQIPENDDELGKLRSVIEAIRANAPDDTQWTDARKRLMATLEHIANQTVNPSLLTGRRQDGIYHKRFSRWLTAAAVLVALLTILLLANVRQRVGERSSHSAALWQVEQSYAVHVRPAGAAEEKPLRAKDVVRAGDFVRVAPEGGLQVRLLDGSRLWLAGGTEAECVGPRSDESPAWRLLRGEIQADIAPASTQFRIATPGAKLRVLGTEFHVRVYPEQKSTIKEAQSMKSATSILQQAIVVLTVLSGSVAVQADGAEKVVPEGSRVTLDTAQQTMTSAEVSHVEYLRKWVTQHMSQPSQKSSSEVLMFVNLHPGLLNRLIAFDVETGKTRHVADFIGGLVQDVQLVSPSLELVNVYSVLYSKEPIAEGSGHPLTDEEVVFIDLEHGEKATVLPLEGWKALYTLISPDRRKLTFLGSKRLEGDRYEAGLLVMDLETFKPAVLLKGSMKTAPAWSPDSRWLAISKAESYQTEGHEIVLIDTLTGEVKSTGLKGAGAVFSPDGKQLIYSGDFRHVGGSFYRGVPTGGNLFIVTLPDGQPEQITHLSEGGAVQPVFSPDGSHIVYWGMPDKFHIVDLAAKKDQIVFKTGHANLVEIRWTHDNAEFLVSYIDGEGVRQVKRVKRQGDDWKVTESKIELPKAGENEGVRKIAQRLVDVFTAHREGLQAQDLHRIEEALKKYALARDLAAKIVKDLERGAGEGVKALNLQPGDMLPYQEAMAKKAAVTPQELSVQVVRKNLEFLVNYLIGEYYRDHDRFPPSEKELEVQSGGKENPSLPSFEEWAKNLKSDAELDYINCATDHDLVRNLFIVPGDDPDKKATSYEVVRSGKEALVLRTPVLANGKRLEATYRVERDETYEYEGKQHRNVSVKSTIAEVD